ARPARGAATRLAPGPIYASPRRRGGRMRRRDEAAKRGDRGTLAFHADAPGGTRRGTVQRLRDAAWPNAFARGGRCRNRRPVMPQKIRRVVTGHDAEGKSTFLIDGVAPNIKEMESMPGLALTDLWETMGTPANNTGYVDAAARPVRLEPPKNGTILRIVEFPPDAAWRANVDAKKAFESIGAGGAKDAH